MVASSESSRFRRDVAYPPNVSAPENLLGTPNSRTLARFEDAAMILRSIEMRGKPIDGALDLNHLKETHRRLFQDVYRTAGTLNMRPGEGTREISAPGDRSLKLDATLKDFRESVLQAATGSHEGFVNVLTGNIHLLDKEVPFERGSFRSILAYSQQLAEKAGYDLNLSTVEPGQWNQARHHLRITPLPDGLIPLRSLVRASVRPLRARAFEEARFSGDQNAAIRAHPELKTVFDAVAQVDLEVRIKWEKATAPESADTRKVGERKFDELVNRVQRALDNGADPQRSWRSHLQQLTEITHQFSR